MKRVGTFVTTHPRFIVTLAGVWLAASVIFGSAVTEMLTTGGSEVPGADSTLAAELQAERGRVQPNLIVEIGAPGGLNGEAEALTRMVVEMIDDHPAAQSLATWLDETEGASPLVAEDLEAGLVIAGIAGDEVQTQQVAALLQRQLHEITVPRGLTLDVGGEAAARADLISVTDRDLLRVELLVIPFAALILLHVFRTPLAAAAPLVVVAIALPGTLLAIRALVEVVEVSIFARSVASVLGLAMAIDMSLFFVAAYREQRPSSSDPSQAVQRAVETVGPSILVSGLTTATALAGLLAFKPPLLRSFAYAGSIVVILAVLGGLVVLPAVITLLGDRIDRWELPRLRQRRQTSAIWNTVTSVASAHRYVISIGVIAVLLLGASPLTRIDFGLSDDRVLPTSVESRSVLDRVRTAYPGASGSLIPLVAPLDTPMAELEELADQLSERQDVLAVAVSAGMVEVFPRVEAVSSEGRVLVEDLRAIESPVEFLVGGEAGRLVDTANHITSRTGWVLAMMVLASFLLLGLLSRSFLVPIKAVLLNLLSLSVMFGSIVWIFQDGRFENFLGYESTGLTDVTVPILMLCVAFGLSMDYEVYLMARIRQEYEHEPAIESAVARGLDRTGPILTASAVLMIVTFGAFATASVSHLKVLGIGLALAIFVDAFVVRLFLVPATMIMAGKWNFWPSLANRDATSMVASPLVLADEKPETKSPLSSDDEDSHAGVGAHQSAGQP